MRRWATTPMPIAITAPAAAYSDTFYGQLAMARTEAAPVLHLVDSIVEPVAKAGIENDA